MSDNPHRNPSSVRRKKIYAKPEIRQVALRAEEAVLGNCKTAAKSGPAQPRCNTFVACRTIAS